MVLIVIYVHIQMAECQEEAHLFITIRKRSCGKVMFLHLSVGSLSRWGLCPAVRGLCPVGGNCPGGLCPGGSLSLRPPRMVEERAVRILLECILVDFLKWTIGQ